MRSPSPDPSGDSAESIYNLLCTVQAQANADEEEIKARRLLIAASEREASRLRAETRDCSRRHDEAREVVRAKRLRVEEQRLRHAGAADVHRVALREVAGVDDALFDCELPCMQAGTACGRECAPPAAVREAAVSLAQKMRAAAEQNTAAAHEVTSSNEDSSGGAGRPFTVRYQREVGEESACTESAHPRRKVVTFNDNQLEVVAEKTHASAAGAAGVRTSPRAQERKPVDMSPIPSFSSGTTVTAGESTASVRPFTATVLNARRLPRRTIWKPDSHKQE